MRAIGKVAETATGTKHNRVSEAMEKGQEFRKKAKRTAREVLSRAEGVRKHVSHGAKGLQGVFGGGDDG